jgi:hypothetical protein
MRAVVACRPVVRAQRRAGTDARRLLPRARLQGPRNQLLIALNSQRGFIEAADPQHAPVEIGKRREPLVIRASKRLTDPRGPW